MASKQAKMMGLARLAADPRTPPNERSTAGIVLAEMIVRGGVPTAGGDSEALKNEIDLLKRTANARELLIRQLEGELYWSKIELSQVRQTCATNVDVIRERDALAEINRHNHEEIAELREALQRERNKR